MPELLDRFGCKNKHCVFYSPYGEEKHCENCVSDDWDRVLHGKNECLEKIGRALFHTKREEEGHRAVSSS